MSVVLNYLGHVLNWFKVNSLKANPEKFQFMVLGGKKSFQYKCKIENTYIFSKDKVVLLGITVDNKLALTSNEGTEKIVRHSESSRYRTDL